MAKKAWKYAILAVIACAIAFGQLASGPSYMQLDQASRNILNNRIPTVNNGIFLVCFSSHRNENSYDIRMRSEIDNAIQTRNYLIILNDLRGQYSNTSIIQKIRILALGFSEKELQNARGSLKDFHKWIFEVTRKSSFGCLNAKDVPRQ